MIQRIQTLYMLGALVCTGLLLAFPVWQALPTMEAFGQFPYGIGARSYPLCLLLLLLNGIGLLAAIFTFKKRKLQGYLIFVAMLLQWLYLGCSWIVVYMQRENFDHFSWSEVKAGSILPIISILLLALAAGGVRKDERLIRSMNRMR